MQLKINLRFKELILPLNYNHTIHGVVNNWLGDSSYRNFIHNQGFKYEKRSFKLYTFSDLIGKYKSLEDGRIKYFNTAQIYVASYDDEFLKYLIRNFIFEEEIKILDTNVSIESIETINTNKSTVEETIIVQTLSPVTVYSTFNTFEGKKKTHFYHPGDNEFSTQIRNNLKKKYVAFHKREPVNQNFFIKLLSKPKLKIKRYKGFLIKGWLSNFQLEGSSELIKLALDSGIGAKNSQGFGFVKEVKNARSYL